MKQPKILLFCPVSNYKDYILWDWLKHIKKLTFKPLDILLIDNSNNTLYAQRIAAEGFNCIHVHRKPGESLLQVMANCYIIFREHFLKNNYDFWFSLECDIFPPVNIIEYLLCHRKQAIGATYFTRAHGHDSLLTSDLMYIDNVTSDQPDTFFKDFARVNGHPQKMPNPGLGCFLIHKSVLQKVSFHNKLKDEAGTDSQFWEDVWNAKIDCWLDTSLNVKHFNSLWENIFNKEKNKEYAKTR